MLFAQVTHDIRAPVHYAWDVTGMEEKTLNLHGYKCQALYHKAEGTPRRFPTRPKLDCRSLATHQNRGHANREENPVPRIGHALWVEESMSTGTREVEPNVEFVEEALSSVFRTRHRYLWVQA